MIEPSDPVLFGEWLEETRALQVEAYGRDPRDLAGQELRNYLIWNHSAAVLELGELLEETRWKPWARWGEGDDVIPDKGRFLKEAVDSLHFIANMLVAGHVTGEELNEAYLAKMQVNRDRQAQEGGYASRRGVDKCPACGRSFEDAGRSVVLGGRCLACEADWMRERTAQ